MANSHCIIYVRQAARGHAAMRPRTTLCRAASLLALGQACNISFRVWVWAFPIILLFRVPASSFGVWGLSTAASLPASRAALRPCGPRPRPGKTAYRANFRKENFNMLLFTFFCRKLSHKPDKISSLKTAQNSNTPPRTLDPKASNPSGHNL